MKLGKCLIVVLVLVFWASLGFAESADPGQDIEDQIEFTLTADYFGKYILRGMNVNEDSVFQPSLAASYGGLTAAIWGNMDMTSIYGNGGDFSEVDYSLDYTANFLGIEGVDYLIGAIHYDFPCTDLEDTTELYWGFSFDLPLNPSVTVYHDVEEAEGTYVSFALGHSVENIAELAPDVPIGLNIGASMGWGNSSYTDYYWGVDSSELHDLAFTIAFPVDIWGWTVAPSLNYVTLISSDIRDSDVCGRGSDFFFAGISLSKSF